MSAPGPHLERLLGLVARFAEPDFVEPARAYTIEDHSGIVRICSGEDLVDPGLLTAEGRDNIFATGFRAGCKRLRFVRMVGDRNTIFFGPHSNISGTDVAIEGSDNLVYFGAFATAGQVTVRVKGNGLTTAIGDRSMLSNRIFMGAPDRRALFSRATGQRLDPPDDIILGPQCWIGRDVMIEPGTRIGQGAIVAQYAVVRGDFPGASILIGSPARVSREGILWARTSEETHAETFDSKHYETHFLQHFKTLKLRLAELDAASHEPAP